MARSFAVWGAILAFLAVGLGAFGAHALRDRLAPESLTVYQTGVQYQIIHALALLALSALAERTRFAAVIGWLFIFGVLIFSGSLYLLAITGERWLGAITPIGGLCFLSGWAAFAFGSYTGPRTS
jgi:uncharacterized membrane protein YgdD (TMEM256/DUF423 family)